MSDFKSGDRVLVDGNLVATIVVYHPDDNLVVFESKHNGGTNRQQSHTSHVRLEALDVPAVPVQEELPLKVTE